VKACCGCLIGASCVVEAIIEDCSSNISLEFLKIHLSIKSDKVLLIKSIKVLPFMVGRILYWNPNSLSSINGPFP